VEHGQQPSGGFERLWRWLLPAVPLLIAADLRRAQFDSVRRQVPMLLAVAALNTMIIMAVCAHDRLPLKSYAWMSLLILYCGVRIAFWVVRFRRPMADAAIPKLLAMNVGAALSMMACLAVATTWTFVSGTFDSILLIPVSLAFGATSIAHCLYTLRPAAIGVIVIGLLPSSVAMIATGPFEAQMTGLAMISVGLLMVRFVAEQYDQLITGLTLAYENRLLALTDPLTGLSNRRAIMAALDAEMDCGRPFAVALIDLDGFKQVNDRFGHHAGDHLLRIVAERLEAAALPDDEVGRLGGDEFVILFRNVTGTNDCSARGNGLLAALCQPVEEAGRRMEFGACLGYAISGEDGDTIEALLHSADGALYAAKRSATNGGEQDRAFRLAA
jgi:diguanylate cyclase